MCMDIYIERERALSVCLLYANEQDAESIAEEVKMTMVKFSTEGWTDQLQERIEDAVAQQVMLISSH